MYLLLANKIRQLFAVANELEELVIDVDEAWLFEEKMVVGAEEVRLHLGNIGLADDNVVLQLEELEDGVAANIATDQLHLDLEKIDLATGSIQFDVVGVGLAENEAGRLEEIDPSENFSVNQLRLSLEKIGLGDERARMGL